MTDEAMSPLRRRMIEDMTIRKFAPKTQIARAASRAAIAQRAQIVVRLLRSSAKSSPRARSAARPRAPSASYRLCASPDRTPSPRLRL